MFSGAVIFTVEWLTKHLVTNGPMIIVLLGVSWVLQQDKVGCLEQTK